MWKSRKESRKERRKKGVGRWFPGNGGLRPCLSSVLRLLFSPWQRAGSVQWVCRKSKERGERRGREGKGEGEEGSKEKEERTEIK